MAKHGSDHRTRSLLAQIDDTRHILRAVVDALAARGTTRNEIAVAARWNAGYLSDALSNPEKKPTVAKTEALIRALVMFVREKGVPPEIAKDLRHVATMYGVAFEPLANPTSGPISSSAENYVVRDDVERALAYKVRDPGYYSIDGPAMSGVSTALSRVARLLQERGAVVARVDARSDLGDDRVKRSKARILGALAAAVVEDTALLDAEHYAVQDTLQEHLEASAPQIGVIIDNVNHLPEDQRGALARLLRDWQAKSADGIAGYMWTTVWLGYTWSFDSVNNVAWHSHMMLDYIYLQPFDKPQTLALAKSLEPFGKASGAVHDEWAEGAARSAREYFNGQPHLTHIYLWDRMRDGRTEFADILAPAHLPEGAFESHLKRLARATRGIIGDGPTEELIASLRNEQKVPDAARESLERIGILELDGRWTSAYYKHHLLGALLTSRP